MLRARHMTVDQANRWRIGKRIDCDLQGKRGHYGHARAKGHKLTLPNPAALGPYIEEGAVNRGPLQALFLLPWGGARPSTGPGAI